MLCHEFFAWLGINLADVPALNDNNYKPRDRTALYDAIRQTIDLAEEDKDIDERVVCVILTDGIENSSANTTEEDIQRLIEERDDSWIFSLYWRQTWPVVEQV